MSIILSYYSAPVFDRKEAKNLTRVFNQLGAGLKVTLLCDFSSARDDFLQGKLTDQLIQFHFR